MNAYRLQSTDAGVMVTLVGLEAVASRSKLIASGFFEPTRTYEVLMATNPMAGEVTVRALVDSYLPTVVRPRARVHVRRDEYVPAVRIPHVDCGDRPTTTTDTADLVGAAVLGGIAGLAINELFK